MLNITNVIRLMAVILVVFTVSVKAEEVNRPKLKVGDCHTYQMTDWKAPPAVFTQSVTNVTDNEITFAEKSMASGAVVPVVMTRDLNLKSGDESAYSPGDSSTYSPDDGMFQFPLSVGKTWEAAASYVRSGERAGQSGSFKMTVTVVGWEKVTVPAGKFSAVKLVGKGNYKSQFIGHSPASGTTEKSIWYVPSQGVVKITHQSTNWKGVVATKTMTELVSTTCVR